MYISQLVRFARECRYVTDFNVQNKCLTAKLLGTINFERLFLSNVIADTMSLVPDSMQFRIENYFALRHIGDLINKLKNMSRTDFLSV